MSNKNKIIIIIGVILLGIFCLRFITPEDTWIKNEKGEWIKHGNPSSPKPTDIIIPKRIINISVIVNSPESGETVSSPFKVIGQARVFENMFNWRLSEESGEVLASGSAYAKSPDAGQFGPFEIDVKYSAPKSSKGILEVFDQSAKDGSEIDKVIIPLNFR